MAISRRRLLASAAALCAVSASAGIFAPAIAQNQAAAHRHLSATLGDCRSSGRERHSCRAVGG